MRSQPRAIAYFQEGEAGSSSVQIVDEQSSMDDAQRE
jgi:hypothetical protein